MVKPLGKIPIPPWQRQSLNPAARFPFPPEHQIPVYQTVSIHILPAGSQELPLVSACVPARMIAGNEIRPMFLTGVSELNYIGHFFLTQRW
jgi:hypothetical protein